MSPLYDAINDLCWTLVALIGWWNVRNYRIKEGRCPNVTFLLLCLIGYGVGWNFAELVKVL
jgi:hypothetical protein